ANAKSASAIPASTPIHQNLRNLRHCDHRGQRFRRRHHKPVSPIKPPRLRRNRMHQDCTDACNLSTPKTKKGRADRSPSGQGGPDAYGVVTADAAAVKANGAAFPLKMISVYSPLPVFSCCPPAGHAPWVALPEKCISWHLWHQCQL